MKPTRTIGQNQKHIIMGNSLWLYMNKRMGSSSSEFYPEDMIPGPVITISREVGCGALKVARKLAATLNNQENRKKWRVISKEILEESARELDMDKQKVRRILNREDRNTFDEILGALGDKRFKSEKMIRKTVSDIIRSCAIEGYVIIVGRGGHLITQDIKRSLHIRLNAPMEWRIKQIEKNNHLDAVHAAQFIDKTEKERESFRKHFYQGEIKNEQFDLTINVRAFKKSQVLELIQTAMRQKNVVSSQKPEPMRG